MICLWLSKVNKHASFWKVSVLLHHGKSLTLFRQISTVHTSSYNFVCLVNFWQRVWEKSHVSVFLHSILVLSSSFILYPILCTSHTHLHCFPVFKKIMLSSPYPMRVIHVTDVLSNQRRACIWFSNHLEPFLQELWLLVVMSYSSLT